MQTTDTNELNQEIESEREKKNEFLITRWWSYRNSYANGHPMSLKQKSTKSVVSNKILFVIAFC